MKPLSFDDNNKHIGEEVFYVKYDGVAKGTVLDYRCVFSTPKVLVDIRDSWETIEIRNVDLYPTCQMATLAYATRLQKEASDKLSRAASLFTQVGVMSETPAVAVAAQ